MNRSFNMFKVCWYCPTNLDIDQFQDSTEVLPILGVLEWVFSFGGQWILQKLRSKLSIFNKHGAHFSVGKKIYWVSNFGQWAGWIYWVGRLIYWVDIFNLLGLFTSLVERFFVFHCFCPHIDEVNEENWQNVLINIFFFNILPFQYYE